MTTDNPAHSAVIKITDTLKNVKYLHYRNGWVCNLANGMNASMTYAGISDNQVQAFKFALAQCHHPAQVLAAVKRYGPSNYTYELESGEGPTLHERLRAVVKEAGEAGYAVVYWDPVETGGIEPRALRDLLDDVRSHGNELLAEARPEEEE